MSDNFRARFMNIKIIFHISHFQPTGKKNHMANQADKKSVERTEKAVIYQQIFLACSVSHDSIYLFLFRDSYELGPSRYFCGNFNGQKNFRVQRHHDTGSYLYHRKYQLKVDHSGNRNGTDSRVKNLNLPLIFRGIFDIFAINCAAQVLYSFTRFGWMIYLAVRKTDRNFFVS